MDEYQALAEQGFRPPGRPPGRLTSTFGYSVFLKTFFSCRYGPRVVGTQRTMSRIDDGRSPKLLLTPEVSVVLRLANCITGEASSESCKTSKHLQGLYSPLRCKVSKCIGSALCCRNARPVRFDFESNEDEDRAIAEAIAREEEIMRQEEEEIERQKVLLQGEAVSSSPSLFESDDFYPTNSSLLQPSFRDSPDTIAVKQVLMHLFVRRVRLSSFVFRKCVRARKEKSIVFIRSPFPENDAIGINNSGKCDHFVDGFF